MLLATHPKFALHNHLGTRAILGTGVQAVLLPEEVGVETRGMSYQPVLRECLVDVRSRLQFVIGGDAASRRAVEEGFGGNCSIDRVDGWIRVVGIGDRYQLGSSSRLFQGRGCHDANDLWTEWRMRDPSQLVCAPACLVRHV